MKDYIVVDQLEKCEECLSSDARIKTVTPAGVSMHVCENCATKLGVKPDYSAMWHILRPSEYLATFIVRGNTFKARCDQRPKIGDMFKYANTIQVMSSVFEPAQNELLIHSEEQAIKS